MLCCRCTQSTQYTKPTGGLSGRGSQAGSSTLKNLLMSDLNRDPVSSRCDIILTTRSWLSLLMFCTQGRLCTSASTASFCACANSHDISCYIARHPQGVWLSVSWNVQLCRLRCVSRSIAYRLTCAVLHIVIPVSSHTHLTSNSCLAKRVHVIFRCHAMLGKGRQAISRCHMWT